MLANKVREKMLQQNRLDAGDYSKANIADRIKQILLLILRLSDAPIYDLFKLGIFIEKTTLLINFRKFSKIICFPIQKIKQNLKNSGIEEIKIDQKPEKFKDWTYFSLGESDDCNSILQLLNHQNFSRELVFEQCAQERQKLVNTKSPKLKVPRLSIQDTNLTQFEPTADKYKFPYQSTIPFIFTDDQTFSAIHPVRISFSMKSHDSLGVLRGQQTSLLSIFNLNPSREKIITELIEPQN
ncbi:hypothetical protein TVAG_500560 [Trichomonas vaginalis G3]|uniref:Uncharacterized protein n=1 Tax=Trichomonas vaginalis (strain ATCC PRA-98 / G3) TaxID=412133 RepID=A2GN52_TRIV3|nr:hypothetical protein TVAGG3_0427470 [Trichomonas vaginalis G3]EAX81415.1 hypothetical protein TVAG_500560 [Trichomonas vaginalis G3]KAI5536516.1 hypothetical protein TVAGG3_0427470 [Trichomonas vaginalis G3]|eukprot:XP_001294345.1 hypothetical protein [Trichomonas vaginalis G3]